MTVVHRPFLPSVQCGSAPPRREKTTRRSCPSNNSSSSPGFFLSPPSLGRAPLRSILGHPPELECGGGGGGGRATTIERGEKKGSFSYVTAVARLSKMGGGTFLGCSVLRGRKGKCTRLFLFHPKRGGERGKDVAMERCHFKPVRERESGSGALLFLRIPLLLQQVLFASNAPSRSL